MAHAIKEISNELNQLLVCTLISNTWGLIKNFMNWIYYLDINPYPANVENMVSS